MSVSWIPCSLFLPRLKEQVISVGAEMELGEVCQILAENHIKKAPVLENGKMIGIINMSNITKYVLQKMM